MYGKYSVLNQPDYKDELKKLNKRIYNKKHRLKKNYGVILDVETKKMEDFANKREFDKFKKSVMDIADRKSNFEVKNKKGTSLELDTVKQTKKLIDQANRVKKERLEFYMKQPFKDRGEDTGWTLGDVEYGFKSEKFGSLEPTVFNPDRFQTAKELQDYLAQKEATYKPGFLEKRDQQYLDNYVKSIDVVFGDDASEIIDKLRSMSSKDFIDMYYTENLVNIEFLYSRRDNMLKLDSLRKQFNV